MIMSPRQIAVAKLVGVLSAIDSFQGKIHVAGVKLPSWHCESRKELEQRLSESLNEHLQQLVAAVESEWTATTEGE